MKRKNKAPSKLAASGRLKMNPVSELAIRAVPDLRTGGVIINGSSTWRAYGGVKDSGVGREGPRYSIRDMTGGRMVFFN